jgi:CRP-like cAMP-binding protein
VGLTVADLIMLAIGTGPVQTGIMVGLAMTVALLIRGGIMFWTEAGVSALLVAGLDPSTHGVSPDRFLEALVGGGAALAVSATFPSNPSLRAKLAARPVLDDLATTLRDVAAALIGGDLELAKRALCEAQRIDALVERLREELDGGLFLIKEGRVRVYLTTAAGKEATLDLLGSGTVLWAWRLELVGTHGVHAQAVDPSVVAFMGRDDLDRFILSKPEVGLRMMDLLAERLGTSYERMAEVIHKVWCRVSPARSCGCSILKDWWTAKEATCCRPPTPTRS